MPLEGENVILREEKEEDLDLLVELRNNLDTQAWSQRLPPDYTLPMYRQRFLERKFSFFRTDGRFIITHKSSEEFIGTISYYDFQPRFSATIGIVIKKEFWGTGVAFDAQETLLKFLFLELGIRVVRIWTQSGNERAVKLAQKSGFRISGKIRKAIFLKGEFFDNLIVDLLREEYFTFHPELKDNLSLLD